MLIFALKHLEIESSIGLRWMNQMDGPCMGIALVLLHRGDVLAMLEIVLLVTQPLNPTLLPITCFLLMRMLWSCIGRNTRFVYTYIYIYILEKKLQREINKKDYIIIFHFDEKKKFIFPTNKRCNVNLTKWLCDVGKTVIDFNMSAATSKGRNWDYNCDPLVYTKRPVF